MDFLLLVPCQAEGSEKLLNIVIVLMLAPPQVPIHPGG